MNESNRPVRKINRYNNYDYSSSGIYYVTICTDNRKQVLGNITCDFNINGGPENVVFHNNGLSEYIEKVWNDIPLHYKNTVLDRYVIMPDHFHGIIVITDETEENKKRATLGSIISAFKSITARYYKKQYGTDEPLWQKSFYDSILIYERHYKQAVDYIIDNPLMWAGTKNHEEEPEFIKE